MKFPTLVLAAAAALLSVSAPAATPAEILAAYTAQAGGAPPQPERGRQLFTTNFGGTLGYSCSSCHGETPTGKGKDLVEERDIAPLAPAANPKRFTDKSKVENAFRLNCKDIVGRLCTPAEKADVMAWLISLKP